MNKYQPPLSLVNSDELDKIIKTSSTEQIAWLSGYLWGTIANQLSSEAGSELVSTTIPSSQDQPKIITVISASQTGNARRIAQELTHDIERLGHTVIHVHVGDYKFKKIEQEDFLIIVSSTQGEGEPPEEALPFYKFLFSKKAPNLSHLNFAVLALGDSSYVKFCQAGKDFDNRLAELGAKRLIERTDADIDYQETTQSWRQNTINVLSEHLKQNLSSAKIDNEPAVVVESSTYTRENPFLATVNVNQKITARESDRDIRHIELDLGDSNIQYQPGDALGVWYENRSVLVDEFLSATKLLADAPITLNGQHFPLRQSLIEKLELTQNTPVIVEKYAHLIENKSLLKLINDKSALRDFCQTTPIIDMVNQYSASAAKKMDAQAFVNILRPLTPRYYSISSAQDEVGSEVHVTVNVISYQINNNIRTGGASGFLAEQKIDVDHVKLFVEHNDNFRLPSDNSIPIIMIAAGTGIAPFRAFLQQRASESATGKNWLFFGNPHFTSDFLYQVEWQNYVKQGILSRIDLAWSRDQTEKIYVQDKLQAQAADVWQWLEQGAYLYVCGDANKIAKAIDLALHNIIVTQGHYDADDANQYLDDLRANKRYQRDIY